MRGETADTLAALQYSEKQGLTCLSLLNVESSRLAEESDAFLRTLAGPEIGVASTKAFTGQLMVLLLTALYGAKNRKNKRYDTCIDDVRSKVSFDHSYALSLAMPIS